MEGNMPNKSVLRKAAIILILTLSSWVSWPVYSQCTADPNDRLYTLISLWEEKGYLSKLHLIRPYPLQVIKGLLKEVEEKAGDHDRLIARTYLRSLFPEDGGVSGTVLRGAVIGPHAPAAFP